MQMSALMLKPFVRLVCMLSGRNLVWSVGLIFSTVVIGTSYTVSGHIVCGRSPNYGHQSFSSPDDSAFWMTQATLTCLSWCIPLNMEMLTDFLGFSGLTFSCIFPSSPLVRSLPTTHFWAMITTSMAIVKPTVRLRSLPWCLLPSTVMFQWNQPLWSTVAGLGKRSWPVCQWALVHGRSGIIPK